MCRKNKGFFTLEEFMPDFAKVVAVSFSQLRHYKPISIKKVLKIKMSQWRPSGNV